MNKKYWFLVYSVAIILCLATAGCVKPPTDESEATQAITTAHTLAPPDMPCSIFSKSSAYAYNGTAFTFTQKNPPMFINYTVIPKNVTVNKVYVDPNTDKTVTLTYSDYSKTSWFEVTVRNAATNEIILQDGFGESKGYQMYLSRTLKVLKNGDLRIEFNGNDIRASVNVWVKPQGNFDESRLSEFTNCMYWEGNRDSLSAPKTTTQEGVIYTWTPENQVTQ